MSEGRWKAAKVSHGIVQIDLDSWKDFTDYIQEELLDYRSFVFRGQRCSNWKLETSFDRLKALGTHLDLASHLQNFKRAVQGRRGPNPPRIENENDWWALGQHHGLATPLLDWSTSPFVAAFFAFAETGGRDQTDSRTVYALSIPQVTRKSEDIIRATEAQLRPPVVEFYRPDSDENPRLLNQNGLFTRVYGDSDLETWVITEFPADWPYYVLIRISIPNTEREVCLRMLNRMNINHLSLFPDLSGASQHCNTQYAIDKY